MKVRQPTLAELEGLAGEIGRLLATAIPKSSGFGFSLLVFDLGDKGHMTYVSNANRSDMIEAMKELIIRMETDTVAPRGMPQHPANKRNEG